jgi:hypothetical protein
MYHHSAHEDDHRACIVAAEVAAGKMRHTTDTPLGVQLN